jgi:hypothetical protein
LPESSSLKDQSDLSLVQAMRARDREVRSHEQAHVAASGGLANGGPSYQFARGPDGRLYATGGEVNIDVSAVANDPRATIDKAQKIRRAALAPTNPSQQDKAVAARASAMAMQAKIEIQRAAREDAPAMNSNSNATQAHASKIDSFLNHDAARSPSLDLSI